MSPAAKNQKGSAASALESSRSLVFPASDTPKFSIYCFCANVWHSVNLGFSRLLIYI